MDHLQKNNMTALEVFPAEVWEIIVENIETTEDVQNFFKAFPALTELQKGKQFSWLIGEVMPLIMSKFLTVKDVYCCRLVSKRWGNSVGTSLETHPDRQPYNSLRQTKIYEGHLNYSPAPNITTRLHKVMKSARPIEPNVKIAHNPFPSRAVSLSVRVPYHKKRRYVNLLEAMPMMRAYGHHIWYLDVYFRIHKNSSEETFVREGLMPLFECLSLLTNLRSLSISGEAKNCTWPPNMQLTALPFQLETLDLIDFSNVSQDVFDLVLTTLCSFEGLQKLKLHSSNWKENFATLFPNLTEVCIGSLEEDEVYEIINDLRSSKLLGKLKINVPEINISKLIHAIGESPLPLKSVKLSVIKMIDWNGRINAPSTKIQDLNISGGGFDELRYFFLEKLPDLKHLTICDSSYDEFDEGVNDWRTSTGQAIYLFAMGTGKDWNNFSGVWDELANLQMITAAREFDDETYQYTRECKGVVFKSPRRDFWNI